MSGRRWFEVIAGLILVLAFAFFVLMPGVQRGGWVELLGVVGLIGAILFFERWLRTR